MTRATAPMTARGCGTRWRSSSPRTMHTLDATVHRVREAVARNIREVLGDNPAQEALVRAEAGRARRHKSLRDLMPQVSAALTAIKPCWAMSPSSWRPPCRPGDGSTSSSSTRPHRCSQPKPSRRSRGGGRSSWLGTSGSCPDELLHSGVRRRGDAVGGRRLTEGFESVLDVLAAALPTRRLTWHYRSRDERLIAFSNATMYDGGLTTFPGTAIDSAVTLEPVEGHAVVQPGEQTIESTSAEVDRVVSLVLDHARRRPHVARRHRPGHQAREPPRRRHHGRPARRPTSQTSSTGSRRALLRQEPRAGTGRRTRRHHPVDRIRQDAPRPGPAPLRPLNIEGGSGDSTWPSRGPGAG